ncbi:MAG: hypothetical protein ACRDJC_25005 [Thermomicrobiales bacterium]
MQRVTLDPHDIRTLQVELTDWARRGSIQPGMEIDLWPFFGHHIAREPDRRAIIEPLLAKRVFGWYVQRSGDAFEEFVSTLGRAVWNPVRRKVVVSQWVRDESASGRPTTVILGDMLGDVVTGTKAGGDHVTGDKIGGHRVSGGSQVMEAGGDMSNSGNTAPATNTFTMLGTPDDLAAALSILADRAESKNERGAVVSAIRWAAEAAGLDESEVEVRSSARALRDMGGASDWVRAALASMVEGATGALVGHWLLEVLPTT